MKTEITMANVIGDEQPTLWQDRVLLDEDFYRALREHPVPVSGSALRAIGPRSMVIDVYIWLAYRLHALKKDTEVGSPALYAQFGAGFSRLRRFRAHVLECLALAMAAYPEARVDASDKGLTLRPSRPSIAKLCAPQTPGFGSDPAPFRANNGSSFVSPARPLLETPLNLAAFEPCARVEEKRYENVRSHRFRHRHVAGAPY